MLHLFIVTGPMGCYRLAVPVLPINIAGRPDARDLQEAAERVRAILSV
jgi:hypothetical protein